MEADESASCVEFFHQSLYSEFWKYGTGRYWATTHHWGALRSRPL